MKLLILLIILLAAFFFFASHFVAKLGLPNYILPAKNTPVLQPATSTSLTPSSLFHGPTGEPHIIGPSGPPPNY